MQNMPIGIFRGDDTDAFGYQTIVGTINTDLDLTGCKAVFRYLDFSMEFDPIPEDKKITIVIPADETKKFPPGLGYASLRVYDSENRLKTFSNRIMVFVATKTPMFGSDEFEVDFNVRPELAPLKIFVGPNDGDFEEYTGFLEKIIDRASAIKYGLSILVDAIDSTLDSSKGAAATPAAVKAAYDAVINKLVDDYYTAEETDEAIDKIAAYYITADANGNPFATRASLVNAQTYYSGGSVRVPTRNDYAIVLADETHDNAEWRYIYAVNAQGVGQWEPQYAVEGAIAFDDTVTRTSANGVKSSGIWSAIWGALSALPTGFSSLYDWCVDQLAGKLNKSGGTITGDLIVDYHDVTITDQNGIRLIDGPVSETSRNYIYVTAYFIEVGYEDSEHPENNWFTQFHLPKTGQEVDFLAALSNIAPTWESGTAYTANALVTYDGVVYRCKADTASPHTATPDADTTHWEAKPVSELFLPLTGGEVRTLKADYFSLTLQGYEVARFIYDYSDVFYITLFGNRIIKFPTTPDNSVSTLALTAGTGHTGNLAALDAQGNPTDSGVKASDKLDASSASAPFSSDSSTQYAVGSHCVYNGKLYKCTTATTGGTWVAGSWTADTMTDPDAVLDITAQNQLRVVAKDGTILWAQGYDLASTSSATLACDAANNFTFADGATSQAFTLPTAPTGKVGDFGLDIDNSANASAATMTLTGLDTAFSVVVPEGESLNDMLAIAAGELAQFYVTLTTFRVNNLPTWHIVKQVVENGGAQS